MARPPIRRISSGNDKIKERTVVVGPGGHKFTDLSDKKNLHKFVSDNKELIEAQNQEIDLTQQVIARSRQVDTNVELNPSLPNPRQRPAPNVQKLPTLEEQKAFLRERRMQELGGSVELPVSEDEEKYDQYEEEAKEDKVSIADIVAPTPRTKSKNGPEPEWMDDEARHIIKILNIDKMPFDMQEKIVNSNRGSNDPRFGKMPTKDDTPKPNLISNIDNDSNQPVDAPPISYSQLRKKVEQEVREEQKTAKPAEEDRSKTPPRFHIKTVETNDEDFQPVTLVSGFVFYDFDHAFVRRFNIADAHALHKAKVDEDLVAFVNAVGASLRIPNGSALDLSPADFRNLCYWHQFYSFPKTPLIVEWRSKYGNTNTYKINERDLKYLTPKLTREQYEREWKPLGLTIPTMRDFIFFNTETLTPDELFLFEQVQWFIGDKHDASFQAKIDSMTRFNSKNCDSLTSIPEFMELVSHGMFENVDVVDQQFDPEKHVKLLQKELDLLYADKETAEGQEERDIVEIEMLNDRIFEINEEIIGINEKLERKERVEPDVETRPINLGLLDFFPGI